MKIYSAPGNRDPSGVYVLMSWVYMWCFTLSQQEKKEHQFRLSQLKQVIQTLNNEYSFVLKQDLFYLLIHASYYNSTYPITHDIYEFITRLDVTPNDEVKRLYWDHRREDSKQNPTPKSEPTDTQDGNGA